MRIGIIGSGMIGGTVGLLLRGTGNDVMFASRHPDQLVETLGADVRTGTAREAAEYGDVLLMSLPLGAIPTLDEDLRAALMGKVVLDTSNPYPQRDGAEAEAALADPGGSGGWVARQLPGARIVKAFNTVYFSVLKQRSRPDAPDLGIPIAGDDADAVGVAETVVRAAGFEPVVVGKLARSRDFGPGSPVYNQALSPDALRSALA